MTVNEALQIVLDIAIQHAARSPNNQRLRTAIMLVDALVTEERRDYVPDPVSLHREED